MSVIIFVKQANGIKRYKFPVIKKKHNFVVMNSYEMDTIQMCQGLYLRKHQRIHTGQKLTNVMKVIICLANSLNGLQ